MNVTSLVWVGTRTSAFAATRDFFTDVMGLHAIEDQPDFAVFGVPDGSSMEVFGPGSAWNRHLTHPVAGFRVTDLDDAVRELEAAGIEIVLPVQGGEDRKWLHFRAPDGFVYELVQDAA
ncbi:MAG TPA: VOC family protein [Jatrophihabitans sp.]|jgi:catechol 2,3-dioxygenase-like lactoylglutathione lyase family enzyme